MIDEFSEVIKTLQVGDKVELTVGKVKLIDYPTKTVFAFVGGIYDYSLNGLVLDKCNQDGSHSKRTFRLEPYHQIKKIEKVEP